MKENKETMRDLERGEHVLPIRQSRPGYGAVFTSTDKDTGKLTAVKRIYQPSGQSTESRELKKEISALMRSGHDNIVEYLESRCWNDPIIEISMELKMGTLRSLIKEQTWPPFTLLEVVWTAFSDMLNALDFLASEDIIHRDVKPGKIMYIPITKTTEMSAYKFQLGGFGLSNRSAADAISNTRSRAFMAPEMTDGTARQTTKVDIWSLFVTVIWALDVQGYRQAPFTADNFPDGGWDEKAPGEGNDTYGDQNLQAVLRASKDEAVERIKQMATVDPEQRPSAAEMIVELNEMIVEPNI